MKIKKKAWPEYFEKVVSGEKNYDLRLGDFKPKPGDILVLQEWDPNTQKYTGRSVEKEVKYIATFKIDDLFWSKKEIEKYGLSIISLE